MLFHTAAYFRESFASGCDQNQMIRINVDGTIALFDAAGREVARVPFALVEEAFDDLDDEQDERG